MASIRDVAKEAGVAVCTVSRVLNGTANVAPETQKKIEAAMESLNYVPNELARGMFRKKSNTIAMLVPNIHHPWFSSLAAEIERELYEKNYKLMLFSTADNHERELECFRILRSNIVDGIICGTSACSVEEYSRVEKPMVMLDYKVSEKYPVIVSDHEQGAQLAAEEFVKSGCKYVIHICGAEAKTHVISYRSHVKLDEILRQHGIQSRQVAIRWNDFDFKGYFELAKCILEEYPRIDGVMAADLPATAFLKAAIALGKRIPEDFCIIAYDGTFVIETNQTKITTIRQSYEKIGKEAVQRIFDMIDGTQVLKEEIPFPVVLEKGTTTK